MDISQLTVLFWLVSHVSSIYFGGIPHGGKKAISTKSEIRLSQQQPGLGIYPWKYIKEIFLIKLKNIKFKRSMRKGKQFYKDRRQNKKYLGYGKIDKKSEERYKKPSTRRGRYQKFRASEGCYKKSSARRYERFHASKEPTKKQYMKYFTRRERHEDFRAQKAYNKNYSRSRRPYKTSSASTRY
ncbi:uncharacterized protein LOC130614188 [Hydractinia symbiolongicarpus]|uniref:uncharacterized protein LOC130614188 n=1 Tax=Hydractinia symbiolongicarpus TaxID=13093 RepID=UPI00254B5B54|nr:uncharacterized protein LOC130614188 [Hydractinia symbiolongicarpus]XP_057291584.1 uncharacterized protein LOC130614188 [Hydractinia symbiolongicarpus]